MAGGFKSFTVSKDSGVSLFPGHLVDLDNTALAPLINMQEFLKSFFLIVIINSPIKGS